MLGRSDRRRTGLRMTREELHGLVWSQPIRTAAASMGISDVALAKRCRTADVPVPPRGWWARKEAGKAVRIAPLPPLPFAMANYFPALDPPAVDTAEPSLLDEASGLPPAPVFRDLAQVLEEIRTAVRPFRVPAVLERPHPIVARLLKQDAARPAGAGRSMFSRDGPRFATPVQQRRLRVLSTLLTELSRLGCKASGSTHAGERFSLDVGGSWLHIFLGVEDGPSASWFHGKRQGRRPEESGRLRFDIVDHDPRTPPKLSWREDVMPLERQATEIVRGLLVWAEEDSRRRAVLGHKWACEAHERRLRDARIAAEKAEADRIAREAAAAAARTDALIGGAEALERAARIRRYVAAVRAAASVSPGAPVPADLDRWMAWALAEADAIDPVLSQRFMLDLDLHPGPGGGEAG